MNASCLVLLQAVFLVAKADTPLLISKVIVRDEPDFLLCCQDLAREENMAGTLRVFRAKTFIATFCLAEAAG